jgi:protein-L-isoaspartate(D-aspartate) O-methyltransferase
MANPRIAQAYRALDRSRFLDPPYQASAGYDGPLPIGCGQTISQPSLVLRMTELLDPGPEAKVLEIGTGSGYQTALLAALCASVVTVERHADLSRQARSRLSDLGIGNVRFLVADGSDGVPDEAPFDRIMVTAAASRVPGSLLDQLAPGGRMVIPVGLRGFQELLCIEKSQEGEVSATQEGGVVFVEFVGRYGFD